MKAPSKDMFKNRQIISDQKRLAAVGLWDYEVVLIDLNGWLPTKSVASRTKLLLTDKYNETNTMVVASTTMTSHMQL